MAETRRLQATVPGILYERLEKQLYSTMYNEDPDTMPIVEIMRSSPEMKPSSIQYKLRTEMNITVSLERLEHIAKMCDLLHYRIITPPDYQ
jgi:hypothetical protein